MKYHVAPRRLQHHGDHRGLRRDRRRRSTTSPRATCSTTPRCACRSRSCPPRSSASTASCRSSSPTRARATAASTRRRRRPSWRPSCGANGVLGVLPGTMGLLQATEVIKLIVGSGEPLIGRLLLYDALGATLHRAEGAPRPGLPDLLARARARSPTRRWASSRTTRRSAPRPVRVCPPMAPSKIPPVLRAVRRRREGGRRRRRERRRGPARARRAHPGTESSCSPPRASSTAT